MIEAANISYRYSGAASDVLHDVSLHLAPASFVAVMGSNGSGKSTLARCLNGLLIPTNGTVEVDGMRTDDKSSQPEIRRHVGLIFQDPRHQITSVTVEREVAFGLQNIGVEQRRMRELVDSSLQHFGLESRRAQSPLTLSGGEQQKLAIACVMALEPKYLILDEATSLLSARARTSVIQHVERLREERKVAIVLVTQFPAEALRADRLIVLHEGQVRYDGTPAEVFENVDVLELMGVGVPLSKTLERFL